MRERQPEEAVERVGERGRGEGKGGVEGAKAPRSEFLKHEREIEVRGAREREGESESHRSVLSENKVKHGLREKQAASASAGGGSALEKQGASAGGGFRAWRRRCGGGLRAQASEGRFQIKTRISYQYECLIYICMHACMYCVCVCVYV